MLILFNLIIHFFAAIISCFVIYLLVSIQKKNELLKKCLKDKKINRYFFATPQSLIKKICLTLSIPFNILGKSHKRSSKALKIDAFIKLITHSDVVKVLYINSPRESISDTLEIVFKEALRISPERKIEFSKELHLQLQITYLKDGGERK